MELFAFSVEQAVEAAGMKLDGIVGAHFVAAIAADAIFGVDFGGCFVVYAAT